MSISEKIKYVFTFQPQSRRYGWVDYAKGIAIIMVVYRHVLYGLLYSGVAANATLMDANEMLYGFRMPLFFFLAGLFYASSIRKRGPFNYSVAKVNTLLYPYVLWCLIELTLQIIFSQYTNHKRDVSAYIDILLHPRSLLQLWYLFALFNVSMLYLFTDAVLKVKPAIQLLLGVALMALIPYVGDISTLSDVMSFYIFFAIGHISTSFFMQEKVQQQLSSGYKILLLLPVFIAIQYYCLQHQDMNIYLFSALAVFGGLLVIMLSFLLDKHRKLVFLRTIGHYSLYIYLLHLGIVFLLRVTLLKTGLVTNMPLLTLLLVTAGIFLSIVLYRICLLLKLQLLFTGPFREREVIPSPLVPKNQLS